MIKKILISIVMILFAGNSYSFSSARCLQQLDARTHGHQLSLTYCGIRDADIPQIVSYLMAHPNIKSVDLSHNYISGGGAQLAALPLYELNLYYNCLSSGSVYALSKNTSLRALNLGSNAPFLTDADAIILSQNTTLKSLDLSVNNISNDGALALSKHPTLVSLNLNGNNISNRGAIALAQNRTLRSLNVGINYINNDGFIALAKNNTLLTLIINGDNWSGYDEHNRHDSTAIQALAKNTTLHSLRISQLTGADLTALAAHPALTSLDAKVDGEAHPDCDASVQAFIHNTHLTHLSIRCDYLSSKGAAAIAQISTLTNVSIDGLQDDAAVIAIAQKKNLRELDVGYVSLSKAAADAIAQNHHLITFSINIALKDYFNDNVSDDVLTSLSKSSSLQFIEIDDAKISDQSIAALASIKTLRYLDLSYFYGNNFQGLGMQGAQALANNTSLKGLNLIGGNFANNDVAIMLANNKNLKTLDLDGVRDRSMPEFYFLKDTAAIALANNNYDYLDMYNNDLTNVGIQALVNNLNIIDLREYNIYSPDTPLSSSSVNHQKHSKALVRAYCAEQNNDSMLCE